VDNFGKIELSYARLFLSRVIARGHDEEEMLINIVTKVDQLIEGKNNGTVRRSGTEAA
jgi:hypothetical protein